MFAFLFYYSLCDIFIWMHFKLILLPFDLLIVIFFFIIIFYFVAYCCCSFYLFVFFFVFVFVLFLLFVYCLFFVTLLVFDCYLLFIWFLSIFPLIYLFGCFVFYLHVYSLTCCSFNHQQHFCRIYVLVLIINLLFFLVTHSFDPLFKLKTITVWPISTYTTYIPSSNHLLLKSASWCSTVYVRLTSPLITM